MTDPPKRRGRPPSGGREAILAATLELLRDRGIANLTTREVAARAGVSDASVYYHFRDRAGLLQAVFEAGMQPLAYLSTLEEDQRDALEVLADVAHALESFFDEALPVMFAAQSDPELREAMAAHMSQRQLGPHRGVEAAQRLPAPGTERRPHRSRRRCRSGRHVADRQLPRSLDAQADAATAGASCPRLTRPSRTISRLLG